MKRLIMVVALVALSGPVAAQQSPQSYVAPDETLWKAMVEESTKLNIPLAAHQQLQQLFSNVQQAAHQQAAKAKLPESPKPETPKSEPKK